MATNFHSIGQERPFRHAGIMTVLRLI